VEITISFTDLFKIKIASSVRVKHGNPHIGDPNTFSKCCK